MIAAGAALMAWALAAHCEAAPRGWALESGLTPQYLLRRGAYRLSRNPMYAGEAVVWLGWALFYRRPAVWAGLIIQCAAFAQIVRWEERRLLSRFGGGYRAYLAQVPRWAPRARRRREDPLPGHGPAAPDSGNVPGRCGRPPR
jgi:protein-S-isoprenylcysteine O-methyltransferase Ste14